MVATTWPTTSPPRCGHLRGRAGELVGLARRVGVLVHGAGELLHRAAVCCRLPRPARCAADRSGVAGGDLAARDLDAVATTSRTWPTMLRSAACMAASERSSSAHSSRPLIETCCVRSPAAIGRASGLRFADGRVIEAMLASVAGTTTSTASSTTAPKSAIRAHALPLREPWSRRRGLCVAGGSRCSASCASAACAASRAARMAMLAAAVGVS